MIAQGLRGLRGACSAMTLLDVLKVIRVHLFWPFSSLINFKFYVGWIEPFFQT
jgi:hypothetical protein